MSQLFPILLCPHRQWHSHEGGGKRSSHTFGHGAMTPSLVGTCIMTFPRLVLSTSTRQVLSPCSSEAHRRRDSGASH
jgi:hypothetical protein